MICAPRWPTLVWEANTVLARECRTVGELLDDSDGLAREALLDMSADRALGIVRGWPQLMQSAAEMWVVIPADPRSRLMVIGSPSRQRWAGGLAVASPRDTGWGRGPRARRSGRPVRCNAGASGDHRHPAAVPEMDSASRRGGHDRFVAHATSRKNDNQRQAPEQDTSNP
jgi:hypothetical protein